MSVSGSKDAASREGLKEFYFFLSLLTVFSLALVWLISFPPLQDYPMRLFIGFVSGTFEDPSYNWPRFFELENRYGSYSFTFWFLRVLTPFVGINAAGKLFLSLYICSVAGFAAFEARVKKFAPWSLLLFLPLAFNQTYIIGLMGYFISIPFLLFALRHLESVSSAALTPRKLLSHCFFQMLIFFAHPFTSLLYAGFSFLSCVGRRGMALVRSVFLAGGFTVFFIIWYLMSGSDSGRLSPFWWSFSATFEFFFLMFAGMKINGGADWVSVALWFCVSGILFYSALRARGKINIARSDALVFFAALAGFFTLPFSPVLPYTYFNIRLVVIVYFFGAILLSNIPMRRAAARAFAVAVFAVVVWQGALHVKLSREIAQVEPVISRMEKNSVVLALVTDGKSAHIDPLYFYQFHNHVPEYYHFLVGGGANLNLISHPNFPIRYRRPPQTLSPRYVLARGQAYGSVARLAFIGGKPYSLAPGEAFSGDVRQGPFRRIARSGLWSLFEVGDR